MFFNEPEYLMVMQLTKKQKQCLGAMFYANQCKMRALVDGVMQYVGTSEKVDGFNSRTINSLVSKGAAKRDTFGFIRPVYENAYIRAIAAQEAKQLAEGKANMLASTMFTRAERLTGDFVKDYDDLLDQSEKHDVIREDTIMLELNASYHRNERMAEWAGSQALIQIFAGCRPGKFDMSRRGYIDFYPEAMERFKKALRAGWDFDTGFYSSKHEWSARIIVRGSKATVSACVDDITVTAVAEELTLQAIDDALDQAAREAEDLWEYAYEDPYHFLGGHDYYLEEEVA